MKFICSMCGSSWETDQCPQSCAACGSTELVEDPEVVRAKLEAAEAARRRESLKKEKAIIKNRCEDYFKHTFATDTYERECLCEVDKKPIVELLRAISPFREDIDHWKDVRIVVDGKPVVHFELAQIHEGHFFKKRVKVLVLLTHEKKTDASEALNLMDLSDVLDALGVERLKREVKWVGVGTCSFGLDDSEMPANGIYLNYNVLQISEDQKNKVISIETQDRLWTY